MLAVILNAGAILELDGSVSSSEYIINLSQSGARLQINGTPQDHCKIFSNLEGPNAYIYDGKSKGSIFCDLL